MIEIGQLIITAVCAAPIFLAAFTFSILLYSPLGEALRTLDVGFFTHEFGPSICKVFIVLRKISHRHVQAPLRSIGVPRRSAGFT